MPRSGKTGVFSICTARRARGLVHIGQAIIDHGGTLEYLRDAVFNYPTLAEAYKAAALNGLNRL